MTPKIRPGMWFVLHDWGIAPDSFRLLLGGQTLVLEQNGEEVRAWNLTVTPTYHVTASQEWQEAME